MGGFQRWDNSLAAAKQSRRIQSRRIGHRKVLSTLFIRQPRVLGTDRRVIEPGGNRMRGGNLSIFVLQHVGVGAVKDARSRAGKPLRRAQPRSVFAGTCATAASLNTNHLDFLVRQKMMEEPNGIRTAAYAGEQMCR